MRFWLRDAAGLVPQIKSAVASSRPRPGGFLFGAYSSGNWKRALLKSAALTPGHIHQRFQKVDKLPIRKGTEGPGVTGTNKAPAIGDQAVHRLPDARMKVSAGINAIVFCKTRNVADVWCIWSHSVAANYTPNQGAI